MTLAIYERTGYADHPNAAFVRNNLGQMFIERKDYAAAEPLLNQTPTILRGRFDAEHEWVVKAVDNLAKLYRLAGREDDAKCVEAEAGR